MKKLKTLILVLTVVLLIPPSFSTAGEITNRVNMTFHLLEGCVFVDVPPVNLLHYITQEFSEVTTKVQFACTAGTSYTFEINGGQNVDNNVRQAKFNDRYAKYRLYWNNDNSEILINSNNSRQGVGNNQLVEEILKVKIIQSENEGIPYGLYTDIITLKITW